jgi:hypothetical protein
MGKLKKRFIIASMGMAILLMTFGSFGSFYPFDVGFYTSIGMGIVWFYFSFYGFKWFLAKK